MYAKGHRVGLSCAVWLALAGAVGCSFAGERPPWAPSPQTKKEAEHCGDIKWPLLDTLWVLAGGTWVLAANGEEERNGLMANGEQGEPRSTKWTRFERTYGYTSMIVFGVSALYGFTTEMRCATAAQHLEAEAAGRAAPQRTGFPAGISGFGFGNSPAQALEACSASGRQWQAKGATALCSTPMKSTKKPDAALEFRTGSLTTITLVFQPSASSLNRDYDSIEASLQGMYGPPQVARAALGAQCAALAECLGDGERPRGPVWHWPSGSIELAPTLRDGVPVLELRYVRESPSER
jgi:hypothetical protein